MRDGKSEMLWAKRLYVTGGSSLGVDRSAAGASGAFSGGFSGAFGAPAATAALMSSDAMRPTAALSGSTNSVSLNLLRTSMPRSCPSGLGAHLFQRAPQCV